MMSNRYLETRILSADPIELVHIVYEHALDMVKDARHYLAAGDIAARSKSICRAIDAVSELDASLNRAQGGQISRNLANLYQYIRTKLTMANLQQQDAPLAEVESLLTTLREAWSTLRVTPPAPTAEADSPRVSMSESCYGALAAESQTRLAGHSWSV